TVCAPEETEARTARVRSGLSVPPVKRVDLGVLVGIEYAGTESAGKAKEILEKTSMPAVAFRVLRDLGIEVSDPEKEKEKEKERKDKERAGASPDGGDRVRGGEPGRLGGEPVPPKKEEPPKPVST